MNYREPKKLKLIEVLERDLERAELIEKEKGRLLKSKNCSINKVLDFAREVTNHNIPDTFH